MAREEVTEVSYSYYSQDSHEIVRKFPCMEVAKFTNSDQTFWNVLPAAPCGHFRTLRQAKGQQPSVKAATPRAQRLGISVIVIIVVVGARIAQSVVCWALCPVWCSVVGSILLKLLVEGSFPLELSCVLTSFPKTPSDESINRGLVFAQMHSIAHTQKILRSIS